MENRRDQGVYNMEKSGRLVDSFVTCPCNGGFLHESSEGLSSTTIPNPRESHRFPPSACSGIPKPKKKCKRHEPQLDNFHCIQAETQFVQIARKLILICVSDYHYKVDNNNDQRDQYYYKL